MRVLRGPGLAIWRRAGVAVRRYANLEVLGSQMSALQEIPQLGPIARYEQEVVDRITDFNDPRQEWRRLFSNCWGPSSSYWWPPVGA